MMQWCQMFWAWLYKYFTEQAFYSLETPPLRYRGRICLQMYYHMYGEHVGSLSVITSSRGTGQPWLVISGDQGNQWLNVSTDISVVFNDQVNLLFIQPAHLSLFFFFSAPKNRVIFGWTILFLAHLLRFGTSHDSKVCMDLKRVTSSFQQCVNEKLGCLYCSHYAPI